MHMSWYFGYLAMLQAEQREAYRMMCMIFMPHLKIK